MKQKYTPEEDKVVLDYKLTDKQIAEKLGRTIESVKARRYLLYRRDELSRASIEITDWPTTTASDVIKHFEDDIAIAKNDIVRLRQQYVETRVKLCSIGDFGECDEETKTQYRKELSSLSNSINKNKRKILSLEKKIRYYEEVGSII